jgi:rod shape-determining protein MreC
MGVVTPDGIVGRVVAAYPTASQVLQVTGPDFAAGVVSQKHRVRGTLRGTGAPRVRIDYVQNEEKVETGEWFYTSGADRTFPRGFPVGQVTGVRNGPATKEIFLEPAALQHPVQEVLILIEGVHQQIDPAETPSEEVYLAPPPPPRERIPETGQPVSPRGATEADRLRERYQAIGEAQKHKFGEGLPGSKPPDFNVKPPPPGSVSPPPANPSSSETPAQNPSERNGLR